MIDDAGAALGAGCIEIAVGSDPFTLLFRRAWKCKRTKVVWVPLLVRAKTPKGSAPCDSTGVETHEIEAFPKKAGERAQTQAKEEADARAAGTTGVEEEGADPVLRVERWKPYETDRDGRAVWFMIVKRHLYDTALERSGFRVALAPANPW